MSFKKRLLLFFIAFQHFTTWAGNFKQIDSLQRVIPRSTDKEKLKLYFQLSDLYRDSSITVAYKYAVSGFLLAKKNKDTLAEINFTLKQVHLLYKQTKYQESIALALSAIEQSEDIEDEQLLTKALLEIGACYKEIEQFDYSKNYLNKALNIAQKNRDTESIIEALNSLGNTYSKGGISKRTEAQNYYLRALQLAEQIDKPELISKLNNNLANTYIETREYTTSLTYYFKSLRIAQQSHDEIDEAFYNNNIGALYLKMGHADLAEKYQLLALPVAEKGNDYQLLINTYSQLALTYEKLDKYVKAYNFKTKLNDYEGRITTEKITRQLAEMQAAYDSLQKQKEIVQLQMKNENNVERLVSYEKGIITLGLIIALVILLLLILVIFLRQRKKGNLILEEKNRVIEKQHLKITDSINYAKRIQDSILPKRHDFSKIVPQSFILFLPKDIVSGDFYWISKIDSKILIAVADCTGHGVPGAFMSMIGSTLLNEIMHYQPQLSPAEILSLLNVRVTKALHQKQGELSSQDDGMDMALCCIDYAKNELIFAGANLSLTLLVRDEISEIRGDVFPIGGVFANKEIRYANKTAPIQSGMMLYLSTDGYKDQFGGEKKEKFKSIRFEKLLKEIYRLPMEEQQEILHENFKSWKGDLQQLDDILIVGMRL
ncbi:MAG: tetratricopeptide repeat protein [Bacteroidetes bacterium]|nr:tetratricopeptide repeat protein [Bacteroidota bacterium]